MFLEVLEYNIILKSTIQYFLKYNILNYISFR